MARFPVEYYIVGNRLTRMLLSLWYSVNDKIDRSPPPNLSSADKFLARRI
jgi:hypothetical protein